MHKVVVERPRWNPGPTKQQRRANRPEEQLPKYEGIRRAHTARKRFTDLLGPLKRWLRSQVGRPWDAVYSEACEVIQPDSIIRAHIKTHLLQFVERHTFLHEGQVCFLDTSSRGGIRPITAPRYRDTLFYVHPRTGLLCALPRLRKKRELDAAARVRQQTQRWLDRYTVLRLVNGCWFQCRVEYFPRRTLRGDSPWRFDLVEHRLICRSEADRIYGDRAYCVARHQLSRRELRTHGLSNQPVDVSTAATSSKPDSKRLVMVF